MSQTIAILLSVKGGRGQLRKTGIREIKKEARGTERLGVQQREVAKAKAYTELYVMMDTKEREKDLY